MRKVITCAIIIFVTAGSFSQPLQPRTPLTQQDYLEKSKKQKTAAKVLSISGAGLILTGLFIPAGDLVQPNCYGWFCSEERENDEIKGSFILAGTIALLSSVPLFIIAAKSKKNAASFSFKNENTIQLYNQNLVYGSVPAIRVKVDF